jgi:hypothetical protein
MSWLGLRRFRATREPGAVEPTAAGVAAARPLRQAHRRPQQALQATRLSQDHLGQHQQRSDKGDNLDLELKTPCLILLLMDDKGVSC